jgi:hypothetical protein
MLKKLVIASFVGAFASWTPAAAQAPATNPPAASTAPAAPAAKPATPKKIANKKPKKDVAKKVEGPKPASQDATPKGDAPKQ